MRYQLFRLSLTRNRTLQQSLLTPDSKEPLTRQQYLLQVFRSRIDFLHYGNNFSFVYVTDVDAVIVGRLGRPVRTVIVDSPENKFAELDSEGRAAVNVFLDTANTEQLLAVETGTIGSTPSIVRSLITRINNDSVIGQWLIDINPLIPEETFWDAVTRYRDDLTAIEFTLTVPNVLGLNSNVAEELKKAKDDNNAQEVDVSIKNKKGIKVETEDIRETVKYVAKGGGRVKLRTSKKRVFDSSNRSVHKEVAEDQDVSRKNEAFLKRAIRTIFK